MNKKLIALLIALAVSPFGLSAKDPSFGRKTGAFFGVCAPEDGGAANRWNVLKRGGPTAVAAFTGLYLAYKGYKNSEVTGNAIKTCLRFNTKAVAELWAKDKGLVIAIYSAAVALGWMTTCAFWDLYWYLATGIESKLSTLSDLNKEIKGLKEKHKNETDKAKQDAIKTKLDAKVADIKKAAKDILEKDLKDKDDAKVTEILKDKKFKKEDGTEVQVTKKMLEDLAK